MEYSGFFWLPSLIHHFRKLIHVHFLILLFVFYCLTLKQSDHLLFINTWRCSSLWLFKNKLVFLSTYLGICMPQNRLKEPVSRAMWTRCQLLRFTLQTAPPPAAPRQDKHRSSPPHSCSILPSCGLVLCYDSESQAAGHLPKLIACASSFWPS